jgi:hypothetical protein
MPEPTTEQMVREVLEKCEVEFMNDPKTGELLSNYETQNKQCFSTFHTLLATSVDAHIKWVWPKLELDNIFRANEIMLNILEDCDINEKDFPTTEKLAQALLTATWRAICPSCVRTGKEE